MISIFLITLKKPYYLYLSKRDILVGAGSAGVILATYLAENKHNVLLLEAGGTAPAFLDIPLLAPMIQRTAFDWQYITIPQKHACRSLLNNVRIFTWKNRSI